jgi:ribosomal-protein-alanine N-acetyltransferase
LTFPNPAIVIRKTQSNEKAMLRVNFTPFPNLTTDRLILRQLKIEDENEIFVLRTDERVNKFLERIKPESLAKVREIIQKLNDGVSRNESCYWVITLKNESKVIGAIGLWNISRRDSAAEIGYELNPDFHGKGIMQEALSKVIKFGFETMNLQFIKAYTSANNHNSIKLLVKNNFKKELQSASEADEKEKLINTIAYSLANPGPIKK